MYHELRKRGTRGVMQRTSAVYASSERALSAPPIDVTLLGSFTLSRGAKSGTLGRRKAQALLAYLLLSPAEAETRDRLCGLLWSEYGQTKAQASLRQTLHHLRKVFADLQFHHCEVRRDEVRVSKRSFHVDVAAILKAAARGEVHPLLLQHERLTEQLLVGFEDIDPAFGSWLAGQRELLKQRLESLLEGTLARTEGQPGATKELANALLNLDPSNEVACRRLMEACAEQGDSAGALKAYRSLCKVLQDEYDAEPSEQTQELLARLRQAVPDQAARDVVRPLAPNETPAGYGISRAVANKAFLVVPEFDCAPVREDERYQVRGFRHELISKLTRFREWIVLDSNQSRAEIAAAGFPSSRCFTIEATACQTRKSVALTITVKELPENQYIWSETYALDVKRWSETQRKIIGRIALALNVHVSADRLISATREPEISLNLYDRWLRGQQLLHSWNVAERARAIALFQAVIEEEPNFAPAYSSLVQLCNTEHIILPGIMRSREKEQRALALAKTAVQLDPLDSRAQLCLAWSFALNGEFDSAELSFETAIDLNEYDSWTTISAAQGLAFCGRTREATVAAHRACRLNLRPSLPHWAYLVGIRFMCGDYQGCIEASLNANDVISNLPAWRAAALAHAGYHKDAAATAQHFVEKIRANWHAPAPPTAQAITNWVLHCFPIRSERAWLRLRDGLSRAQLPVPAIRAAKAA